MRLICGGRLTVYARQFARLRGVVIDRRQAIAQRRGADAPVDAAVLNQPSETDELYSLAAGFFVMFNCTDTGSADRAWPPSDASFNHDNYLNHWITATRIKPTVSE